MNIKILHNVAERPLRMLEGYQDEDPLVHVFDLESPRHVVVDQMGLREWCFMVLNVGDVEPHVHNDVADHAWKQAVAYRKRKNRSLSVGDVIFIDGKAYACDTVGWRQVTVHPHQIVTDVRPHGTTPIDDPADPVFEAEYDAALARQR